MEISIATEADRERWDEVVASSAEGTLFHTWKWLKIMEKHNFKKQFSRVFKGKLYPLMVWEGSELFGLMPVYFYDIPFYNITSSPPYGIDYLYLGPIINKKFNSLRSHTKQRSFHKFQKTLDNFLKNDLKSKYIQIVSSPGLSDPRPFLWNGYQTVPLFTNMIELKEGEQRIWENFSLSVRKSVNKALNKGIIVDTGSKTDLELLMRELKNRGRIYSSKDFFSDIFDNFFPDNLNFFIVKKNGVPLTGLITTRYKNKVSAWVGTPRITVDGVSPNFLLHWEAIRWACKNKYEFFENMGATEPATFPFKSKFNPEIIPHYIFRWYSPIPRVISSIYHGFKPRVY